MPCAVMSGGARHARMRRRHAMMPTMNYPYPPAPVPAGGSRIPGGRGPWWVRVMVSAAITVLLWGLSLVILIVTHRNFTGSWANFIAWTVIYLLFVVILVPWGRTLVRGILGAVFAFVLLAISHALTAPPYGIWINTHDWYSVIWNIVAATFLIGTIGGWSIARRSTPYAWIGVIPVAGVVCIGTWVLANHMANIRWLNVHIDSLTWWWFANVSIQAAFVIAGVLVVWACDAIGLALRRDRPTPTSGGSTAAWGTQGGPAPWPPSSPATSGQPSWPAGQQPVWPSQPPPAWPTPPPQAWPGQPPSQPPAGT
ncbi:putative membrane protein [Gordonia polyisoprenivorans VH2]|uniref:Putative membrane protein n=2 Tax=Gordonia polyisoprenivorans TaxID=84595 RepID=H6MYV2_GORPV|nr:putative membrane protein [Gordonia polyisoprenivorans VH2]